MHANSFGSGDSGDVASAVEQPLTGLHLKIHVRPQPHNARVSCDRSDTSRLFTFRSEGVRQTDLVFLTVTIVIHQQKVDTAILQQKVT